MASISIVGAGYVGLVTGACMARMGHRVRCIDIDVEKVRQLRCGTVPFYEPGLQELVGQNLESERLSFHTCYAEGLDSSEFVFMCVDTPAGPDGSPLMDRLQVAVRGVIEHVAWPVTIINKSTVPVGTGSWVREETAGISAAGREIDIVSCPEFLSEGSALHDFMNPDRIVLGCLQEKAAQRVAQLFRHVNAEVLITDLETAEMIKYASNAYLATRISFVNQLARFCEGTGIDIDDVTHGMSHDRRIGSHFLKAGIGFGGSCFPKDLRALRHLAQSIGADTGLLNATLDVNRESRCWVVRTLQDSLQGGITGSRIALLGLSFKPGTDDLRGAPALDIVNALLRAGAEVTAYDPVALAAAQEKCPGLDAADDAYAAATGADAMVFCTEWDEFQGLDMRRMAGSMRGRVLVDGRNIHDPDAMRSLGLTYFGVGRGRSRAAS